MRSTLNEISQNLNRASILVAAGVLFFLAVAAGVWLLTTTQDGIPEYAFSSTLAGFDGEFDEPFGIAVRGNDVYISDGGAGKVFRLRGGEVSVFAEGFNTPSAMSFDKAGNLIVADSGSHSIRSIDASGKVVTLAGQEGRHGSSDGDATTAMFHAPIGVAIADDGAIFVADTYNDRIRKIENGTVSTVAGSNNGFADGASSDAMFDTPAGIAIWNERLLVADTGNKRIRVIESDGSVWTLAGNGGGSLEHGLLLSAEFVQPTAIAVSSHGSIYITDGDAIRRIDGIIPTIRTISGKSRGVSDGPLHRSRFNRPSAMAFDDTGDLIVADSDNRLVRRISPVKKGTAITKEQIEKIVESAAEFRRIQPARWPYDPPLAKRDVAGTFGEIRGEITPGNDQVWFHYGLDIAGAYGETARFIRDEKVLRPVAAEHFGTLREFLRMPTLGYIHIRLGRDQTETPFEDPRFLMKRNETGRIVNVRVPRGSQFRAGEAIGTLNRMNHVHLVAGRAGFEMNALSALELPGLTDSRPPVIESVELFDENWTEIETSSTTSRINLSDKIRIVVRAYDQVDGNPERRKLGVYRVGYQIIKSDDTPVADPQWTLEFDHLPDNNAVMFAYAEGSHSGAMGETIFRYIASNRLNGEDFGDGYVDIESLSNGQYTLRVMVADFFSNITSKDIEFEVNKYNENNFNPTDPFHFDDHGVPARCQPGSKGDQADTAGSEIH